jgi:GxxExxY protein
MNEFLFKDEVYTIVGAAIEAHRELGPGFLEAVYEEALHIELEARSVPHEFQKPLPIDYKGRTLSKQYVADLICYGGVIVEIKAISNLTGREEAQLLNYLKASGLKVGLLINFGSHGRLEWKRLVM